MLFINMNLSLIAIQTSPTYDFINPTSPNISIQRQKLMPQLANIDPTICEYTYILEKSSTISKRPQPFLTVMQKLYGP